MSSLNLYESLVATIATLDVNTVSAERQKVLQPLIKYIKDKRDENLPIRLNFICTHNSRRSHLSQIWAQCMAAHYGLSNVHCYSGGTETTALFPKVLETLIKQGFITQQLASENNPVYAIKYGANAPAIIGFSKTYDDDFNPSSEFAAIMTCFSADEACPIVLGCEERIAITYKDPKISDGTLQQNEVYLERSFQIATEMKLVFRCFGS
ncbi:MAG: protein-tyrosine-phosphatase [Flavobacteriaceae bacterium]|nr:protein-tyrosine-phosphatase [Flavobacteriaceae bacterium]